MPNLHLVFVKGGDGNELLEGARTLKWTAPKTARKNDIALFYVGGIKARGILGVGRTAADAYEDAPAAYWTKSKKGFSAKYDHVRVLERPISLYEIQAAFPKWTRWKKLLGVRVHTVPAEHQVALAKWVSSSNPKAEPLLRPWLSLEGNLPDIDLDEELRYEGAVVTRVHRTYERNPRNRAAALRAAKPPLTCQVCGFNFAEAYGKVANGFIEVHHASPVSRVERRPKLKDLVVLCSNCHSIAHWKQGQVPLSLKQLRRMWNKGKCCWSQK